MLPSAFSLKDERRTLNSSEQIYALIKPEDVQRVTDFSIDGNSIGVGAGVALGELVKSMTQIKSANFSNIFSQRQKKEIPEALAAICDGLKSRRTLLEVDLSDNAIGAIAVASIVPLLVENTHLRVLKINNVGMGPEAGTIVARALHLGALIQTIHKQPSNLGAIICGQSRLENGSASAWSDAFTGHSNLAALHIPQNGIKELGLTAIARGLESCRSLRYLNVSDNTARESHLDPTRTDPNADAATAFANALAYWPELEYLNLSDCCLKASGTSQVIDALSKGNSLKLKALLLENASFDESFGEKLLSALGQSLPNLSTLKLSEHEGLGDPEDDATWAEITRIITGRGGVVEFERDIEDDDDTSFLDKVLADLVDDSADGLAEAMGGLSV
ncbi:hypothetical protein C8R43DRAFT_1240163 [Mycena crocata]|nr:hypothetical protein C8R43DRAFT_1240163 [Mycena crocata]